MLSYVTIVYSSGIISFACGPPRPEYRMCRPAARLFGLWTKRGPEKRGADSRVKSKPRIGNSTSFFVCINCPAGNTEAKSQS